MVSLTGCSTSSHDTCIDKNCADYPSQAAAQQDFDANPECRNDLDADNDSLACEQWFGSEGTRDDCPKTASCGCSNNRKAECTSACCQWIVGEGCKCAS